MVRAASLVFQEGQGVDSGLCGTCVVKWRWVGRRRIFDNIAVNRRFVVCERCVWRVNAVCRAEVNRRAHRTCEWRAMEIPAAIFVCLFVLCYGERLLSPQVQLMYVY